MLSSHPTLLRMPMEEDKPQLLAMRNDIELQSMLMSRAKPNSPHKIDEWLNKRLSDENGIFFIISDVETNEVVGYLQLLNIDLINRRGELGICMATEYSGKGYATQALKLLELYIKKAFNIQKITLQVLSENLRAINFYKKTGFRQIGIYEDHFYFNNIFHDVVLMEKKLY